MFSMLTKIIQSRYFLPITSIVAVFLCLLTVWIVIGLIARASPRFDSVEAGQSSKRANTISRHPLLGGVIITISVLLMVVLIGGSFWLHNELVKPSINLPSDLRPGKATLEQSTGERDLQPIKESESDLESDEHTAQEATTTPTVVSHENKKERPIAKAMFDFDAENERELTCNAGEKFEVLREHGEWWYVKSLSSDKEGYIPANYLQDLNKQI